MADGRSAATRCFWFLSPAFAQRPNADVRMLTETENAEEERAEDHLGAQGEQRQPEQTKSWIRSAIELGYSGDREAGNHNDGAEQQALLETNAMPEPLEGPFVLAEVA